jgi:DNA-binding GntR family transcriptional regulator
MQKASASGSALRKTRSASGQAMYDIVRGEILTLKLAPGQEIDELGLAARFKVSRTPVREVLVRLAAEDLVEMRANRGARVALMNFAEIPAMIEILEIFERLTGRRAARFRSQKDLDRLLVLAREFEARVKADDHLGIVDVNWHFHDVIHRACRNPFLAEDATRALTRMLRISTMVFGAGIGNYNPEIAAHHYRIIDALAARDEAAIDGLMVSHNDELRRALAEYLGSTHGSNADLDLR